MLGGHHEERGAEQRVGARREDRVIDAQLLAAEDHLRPLRAPDPVALHRLDMLGPVDRVEVLEQPLRVIGDAEEPLLELAPFHQERRTARSATSIDLLIGKHRRVIGTPIDGGVLAIGETSLKQLAGRSIASTGNSWAHGCRTHATSRSRSPTRRKSRAEKRRSRRPSSRADARRSGSHGSPLAARAADRSPSDAAPATTASPTKVRDRVRRPRSTSDDRYEAHRLDTATSPPRNWSGRPPLLGTCQAPSASQTPCQRGSISAGS